MKIFLDANVLVSVLNKEYPQFPHAARVLSLVDKKEFQIFTSTICLAIAFYFSSKKCGEAKAKEKIRILTSKIQIAAGDQQTVTSAIENRKVLDFEDGLEYYAALKAGCLVIVTEELRDFHFSEIPVYTAEQFLSIQLGGK